MTEPFVITRAEVEGRIVDVAVDGGTVTAVGPDLSSAGVRTVDAAGGALIPGLHDHHLHLLAIAAARTSLRLDQIDGAEGLDQAISAAHARLGAGEWLRVVGLDDRHGPVDRHRLDRLAPGRPVRAQHRSGAAWVLSSPALVATGVGLEPGLDGARDDDGPVAAGPVAAGPEASGPHAAGTDFADGSDRFGMADGWLHRMDESAGWPRELPDLGPIGERLARYGVTGVTDATPFTESGSVEILAEAHRRGRLPQRLMVTGAASVAGFALSDGLERGPVKVVVSDHALPGVDELVAAYRAARSVGRPVAVHCVTRVGLVLALAAWSEVGAARGDRVEHGSVIPVELIETLVELGLTVVTQPGFIADRGDRYLAEVDSDDVPHLYRCGSLIGAGVPVAGSTDAPFGPDDPWIAIAAAVDRRSASGAVVGGGEALEPAAALDLFLGRLSDPGGPPRRIEPGVPADIVMLERPLPEALVDPTSDNVRATWIAGKTAFSADGSAAG